MILPNSFYEFTFTRPIDMELDPLFSYDFLDKNEEFNLITKGSSRGATLSFTLRSKGEGGQPRYLIIQEIASHFSTPPHPPPSTPPTHPKSKLKTL